MRPDLEIIQHWIDADSRVLDLGCGDGSLLQYLKETRNIFDIGLEIDAENINQCLEKGVNVIEQNIDKGLDNFQTGSFDTVLLTQTLQASKNPDRLIDEMLRIGTRGIVTFPNFGNWKSRLYLFGRGRMPVSKFIPYQWYDTPNIHFCTVRDFDELCKEKQIRVLARTVVNSEHQGNWYMKAWPNFLGEIAIYHLTRD
jgi:methionine biosynthesis protein MetW